MNEAKHLILGSGLLAHEVARHLGVSCQEMIDRRTGDIRDLHGLRNAAANCLPIASIINCAAYTAVDRAEEEPDIAMQVNALGAENAARLSAEIGCPFVHFSTDAVFSQDQMTACVPDELVEPSRPESQYGRSKLAGERLVRAIRADAHIIRVANLYGDAGHNWASFLRDKLEGGDAVRGDAVRVLSPTWARWVAEVAVALLKHPGGVYHACATGSATWAGFAELMQASLGEKAASSSVARMQLERRAPLPPRGQLTSIMLGLRQLQTPSWQDLLARYLREERTVCIAS